MQSWGSEIALIRGPQCNTALASPRLSANIYKAEVSTKRKHNMQHVLSTYDRHPKPVTRKYLIISIPKLVNVDISEYIKFAHLSV